MTMQQSYVKEPWPAPGISRLGCWKANVYGRTRVARSDHYVFAQFLRSLFYFFVRNLQATFDSNP
jgi:hypothetical protein